MIGQRCLLGHRGPGGCSLHAIGADLCGCGKNSPDNQANNAPANPAKYALWHSAPVVGTPKMPGEPARVQPSRMTQETREIEGLA
jgi:hypothetical protein